VKTSITDTMIGKLVSM